MVVAGLAREAGYRLLALTIDYNQRHRIELEAAARIAVLLGAERHIVLPLDLTGFGGSALTADIEVPKDRDASQMATGVPVTYVPARNTIFLSYALAWAEVLGAREIFIGVNALDYSGYPDCRPEYIDAFERLANLATRAGVEGDAVEIRAPLIDLSKREIIDLGTSLGVDYSLTTSCYDPGADGAACGRCDACQLRLKGFSESGRRDPARYVSEVSR